MTLAHLEILVSLGLLRVTIEHDGIKVYALTEWGKRRFGNP